MNSTEIIELLDKAAKVNRSNPFRQGNIIKLPDTGKVVMTGDLHGNHKNFDRIVKFANLNSSTDNHLIIHELIHDPNDTNPHECHSYTLVVEAAKLLIKYPGQVHYMMGNHAMAQITEEEVLKSGKPMVKSLNKGLTTTYGIDYLKVFKAFTNFVLSLPLVVRTANNIWMSHSLPDVDKLAAFDYGIFDTEITTELLKTNKSIRTLLWGRKHTEPMIDELAKALNVDTFIVGHQPQPEGYSNPFEKLIILASDHHLGTVLPFDLAVRYEAKELFGNAIKIAKLS